ncbi:MAG: RNA methyltransferase [Candidatus Cloacimonadales bacterium]
MNNLYLGLVHYPINNKFNQLVTTSITNLDVHDIARSCTTFGVSKYFIINRLESQKEMLMRILKFWHSELAEKFNPDRVTALSLVEYAADISAAKEMIKYQEGEYPLVITTTAAKLDNQIDFAEFSKLTRPVLLLFGTGNGLAKEVHEFADFILKPIVGYGEYNHLSVRSAVAIILDRIRSEK